MIAEDNPAEQEKSVKWNSLLCNLIVFHTAIDMMEVIRQLVAEGWQVRVGSKSGHTACCRHDIVVRW